MLRVRLLGEFGISAGGEPADLTAWRLRKSQAVVKLLALAPGHRLHRDELVEALWPELSAPAAGNNLHYALHAARRVLPPGTITLTHGVAALSHPDAIEVDAVVFEIAARRALAVGVMRRSEGVAEPSPDATAAAALEDALALYAGDLLPEDRYEEWAAAPRERLRELYFALLVRLAAHHERAGDVRRAAESLGRILDMEPGHEVAHGALIRLHAAAGGAAEARRAYERLEAVLRREYQAEPDPALRRLVDSLGREGGGSTAADHTAHQAGGPRLPLPLTRFVGREREIQRIERALRRGRLVTLAGPGGAGKTRLAVESASRVAGRFPGGVWLVELSAVADAAHVASAVAAALGTGQRGAPSVPDAICAFLTPRPAALLVLDNCEHVLAGCAQLASAVLPRAPLLTILATSRRPLGVLGETVIRVPPLSLPAVPETLAALRESEAVRLFEDRARLHAPWFRLTTQTASAVASIVHRLDGLPLAIELAAARMGALSVGEIAARLEQADVVAGGRFTLLSAGNAGGPARHRSLTALVAWTYDALSEAERRLFRRLSVFAGGWTLEAASAVCGDGEDATVALAALVEHSLVNAAPSAGGTDTRYAMLDTLRAYAAARLEREEGLTECQALRRRHALHYAEHVVALKERVGPSGVERLFAGIQRELDNLRAALRWTTAQAEVELGLRLGVQLSHFWHARGSPAEGLAWVEALLALVTDQPDGPDDTATSEARRWYVMALESAASLARIVGEFGRARAFQERYLALRRAQGDRRAVAAALVWLATIADVQGDGAAARAALDECLAIAAEIGDERVAAWALQPLATMAQAEGRLDEAAGHLQRWLAHHQAPEQRETRASGLLHLGSVRYCLGDLAGARRDLEAALTIGQQLSNVRTRAGALLFLGWVDYLEGAHQLGEARIREALALLRPLGLKPQLLRALEQLGVVHYRAGQLQRAALLLGAAEALREELPANVMPQSLTRGIGEPLRPPARERLASEGWAGAWAAGRAMGLEAALDAALAA